MVDKIKTSNYRWCIKAPFENPTLQVAWNMEGKIEWVDVHIHRDYSRKELNKANLQAWLFPIFLLAAMICMFFLVVLVYGLVLGE